MWIEKTTTDATLFDICPIHSEMIARRFKKQIFLSVDMPATFFALGQGPQLAFEAEKRLVETLKELEQ